MNRLHKKCVITSAGVHGLLAAILLFCPAFLAPNTKVSDVPPIDFIPSMLIDGIVAGGGDPKASPPPAAPPAPPAPVIKPAPAPPPEPIKETVKEVAPPKTDEDSLEPAKVPPKRKVEVSLTPVVRKQPLKPTSDQTSEADNQESQERDRKRRLAGVLSVAANTLKDGIGQPTKNIGDRGPGGGGPSYAPYDAWVWKVYREAWVIPEDAATDDATVEVTVIIASDGTVIGKRISRRSGDSSVDASVQRLLDRVSTIGRPFPEGAKEKQRSFIIPFNMKTKRGTA